MRSNREVASSVALLGLLALAACCAAQHGQDYGYDDEGYDKHGYDKYGYDKYGHDKDGYHYSGYHKDGYDSHGYDKYGFDRHGHDSGGYDRGRYLPVKRGYYPTTKCPTSSCPTTPCPPLPTCSILNATCGGNTTCCNGLACSNSKCCVPLGSSGCSSAADCCAFGTFTYFCAGGKCVNQDCGGACVSGSAGSGAPCKLCNNDFCPTGINPCGSATCQNDGTCDCFPASSTVRRLVQGVKPALAAHTAQQNTQPNAQLSKVGMPDAAAWETVTLPELRVGDFVECVVPRPPGWLGSSSTAKTVSSVGELDVCQLYSWKAQPHRNMGVKVVTFKYPDGSVGTLKASLNHHFYAAAQAVAPGAATPTIPPGTVKDTAHVTTADVVTTCDPATGLFYTLPVESVTTEKDAEGVYAPYLTKAGLLLVDGAVMYSSATRWMASGPQDPENEDKHWGRFYLLAPLWQAVEVITTRQLSGGQGVEAGAAVDSDIAAAWGMRLYDLGDKLSKEVPLLDKQWAAVAEAAGAEARVDWRGLAQELHTAIAVQGRRVSRADVLRVLRKHMVSGSAGTSVV